MRVKVRNMLSPERVIRNETLAVELPEGATVRDLLARLPLTLAERKRFLKPDGSDLNDGMGVLVDRQNVGLSAEGLDTKLQDGATVALIYLIAGG